MRTNSMTLDQEILGILTMNPNPVSFQTIASRIQFDGYANGLVWITLNRLLTKGLIEQIDENYFKIKK